MWRLIIGGAAAALIAAAACLTVCIGRFGGIRKLAGDRPGRKYLFSFLAVAAGFGLVAALLSVFDAVVVLLFTTVFFVLCDGLARIVSHVSGKTFSVNWQGWLALAVALVYFVSGYVCLHHVWQTDYALTTAKDVSLKIAVLSDSHLSNALDGDGFAEQIRRIGAQEPDIVLIAGDFVDDKSEPEDVRKACEALGEMNVRYGVWYAYGNHDRSYERARGLTPGDLERMLRANGVCVLEDDCVLVDGRFYLAGRADRSNGARKPIGALLDGAGTDKYIIVIDHQPNDYENEAASAADLVVSGHTHGGQLFPVHRAGECLRMNDRTYGHERRNGTDFIVTSGISCWGIRFKTGTRSEYALITVSREP